MFSIALLILASLASSNALVVPRTTENVPATYAQGYLEPYKVYHTRYLALDCQDHHNSTFFDACCHPMLATENLKNNRAPECSPSSAAVSSAIQALPTSTVIPSGDGGDDCEDDGSSSPVAAPTQAHPSPPKNVGSDPSSSESKPSNTPVPKPSSTPAPKPSSTPAPKPSSSHAPKPSPSASSGGILGNLIKGGVATFFFQNGVAGACGTVHQDSDFVVALPTAAYENGKNCGRKLEVIDPSSGKTHTATVADECPTCDNNQCLDLSHALFNVFTSDNQGEFNMQYRYLD